VRWLKTLSEKKCVQLTPQNIARKLNSSLSFY